MKAISFLLLSATLLLPGRGVAMAQVDLFPAPVASPPSPHTFVDEVEVTLSLPDYQGPDAVIKYDTNPGSPTYDQVYEKPFKLTATTVVHAIAEYNLGQSEAATFTYTRNARPTAAISWPTGGQILRQGSSYNLIATASDPEGGSLKLTYQYLVGTDGGWQDIGTSTAGPSFAVAWTPSVVSAHQLRALVEDGLGAQGISATVNVTVTSPNLGPLVDLTHPTGGSVHTLGSPVSLTATATDQDDIGGAITKVDFYNRAGLISSDTDPPYTAAYTPSAAGPDTLQAKAWDNHSPPQLGVSAVVPIIVNAPNKKPVVTTLAASPTGPFPAPANFTVTATATDTDGTVAAVQFYQGGVFKARDTAAPFTYPVSNLPAGSYQYTARAFDNSGDSSAPSITVTVTVNANQAPTAHAGKDTVIVQPVNTVALNGGGSTDPEGTALSYAWSAPAGVTLANANTATPTATINATGDYSITLTVTDKGSPALSDDHTIKVSVHSKPVITSKLVDSATINTPYTYTMTATGFPSPNFILGAVPGWLNRVAGTNNLTGTPTSAGSATVTFTASNGTVNETKTLNLTVRQAPVITQDLPDSVVMQERQKLTFTVAATGTPAPTYQWQLVPATGSPVNVGGTSATFIIDTLSLSHAGVYRVIARNGVNPPDTSRRCRVIVKQLIRIATQPIAVTAQAGRNATLQVRATGAPTLLYQWFKGAAPLGPAAAKDSNLILNPVKLADAGVYRVRVTNPWSDTTQASTFKWSDTARITVTQPKIDKPKATPAAPADYGKDGISLTVKLHTDTPGTTIRYTTNGTNPTATTGTVQPTAGIVLTKATATIKAIAFKDQYLQSDMFTGVYTYVEPSMAAKPTARPVDTLFGPAAQPCTLTTSTPGGVIKYTLNGTNPKTSPNLTYDGPFQLTVNTTVTAYATAAGYTDSDTLVKVYTLKKIVQTAQTPAATPPAGTFTDSLPVTLFSATDSSTIYYTTDGSAPESSPTRKAYAGTPIVLTQSTVLRSIATRANWNNSATAVNAYTRIPGPVVATPAPVGGSHVFDEQVTVKLSATPSDAKIYYTLNDSTPLDARNLPISQASLYTAAGIVLQSSYTITAMAIKDTVPSKVFRFAYTRKGGTLNTPLVITPGNSYAFKDTLRVTLVPTNGATIHYTLNGDPPNESSPVYPGPFTVDTTTTLHAIAYHKAFQPSKVLVATFTLVADTPTADPPGGDYASTRQVVLKSTSRKTPILYTLDGTVPGPDNGIRYQAGEKILISKPAVLRAVALANGLPGPMRVETYNIFGPRDTLLAPGETYFLVGGYTISNPADQGVSVRVRQGSADSLFLPGFKDVQYSLILSPAATGTGGALEFPALVLARSSSENRGLYKVLPDGRVYYVSGGESVPITEPGTYFMGTDVEPPVITYLGETLDDTGATSVRFKVTDNVYNLLYNAKRSDNPAANVSDQPVFSGSELEFSLKHPAGSLKALTLQVSVTDYKNVAFCPPGGQSFLPLSQKLTNVQSPEIWRIGRDAASPHDLVGIPVQLDPPLTVADLGDVKAGARVEAFVYVNPAGDAAAGTWRKLGQSEALVAGQAYWLGSRSRVKGFRRASARTAAQGLGKFTVALRHGWNQVANPHLENLYWPFSRDLGTFYTSSPIKGLWAYTPEDPRKYLEREVLEPWQGYFVYNHRGDTVIELSSKPMAIPAPKKESAASPFEASLSLVFGDAPAVRLGATLETGDALGWEDEGLLPSLAGRHALRAVRQGRGLSTDLIRFEPERILQWRILPYLAPGAAPGAEGIPAVKVLARSLPEGYEAWAISRARGMKFKLAEGQPLPASGLPEDTLIVAAGPAAKLARWDLLKGLAEEAPDLDLRVGSRAGVPEFRLDLPGSAAIRATLWTLRGTSVGELERNLSAGRYRFTFAEFRRRVSHPAPGVHFLRVEIRSQGRMVQLARKIVFRP